MLLKANFIVLSHFHKAIVNNQTQKECGGSSQLALYLLHFIPSLGQMFDGTFRTLYDFNTIIIL